jgi:archaemetzincin
VDHLDNVAESVKEQFGIDVTISENLGPPEYAYDSRRKQYNSNLILKNLLELRLNASVKILGVTDLDLFSPIFSYVFGEAQLGGRSAVVSTFRLQGDPDDPAPHGCPPLISRLEKEVMHELGHTFGLRHCVDPDCVMHYSTGVQCADRKFSFLCPACHDLMLWNLAKEIFLKVKSNK